VRALLHTAIRRLRGERGFTLPEVLMALVIGLLVVGVGTTVFSAALRSQPGLNTRSNAISQARFAMERLTRELRQGATVYASSANQLAFITYVNSATCGGAKSSTAIQCRVTYTCTTMGCSRVEAKPDGTAPGPAVTVVTGLQNPNVFSYSPNSTSPTYIGATFSFAGQNGDDAITVSDGAALRNPAPPGS
jgi:prepilin-type N-terminal cleavage/methylation domain-containing protein